MTETTKVGTFILRDEAGNFISGDSIYYDKETKKYFYSYSEFLTNGFYTYPTQQKAERELQNLREMAKQAKFKQKFRVEKIDMPKIIKEEGKLDIPKYPFQKRELVKSVNAIA